MDPTLGNEPVAGGRDKSHRGRFGRGSRIRQVSGESFPKQHHPISCGKEEEQKPRSETMLRAPQDSGQAKAEEESSADPQAKGEKGRSKIEIRRKMHLFKASRRQECLLV